MTRSVDDVESDLAKILTEFIQKSGNAISAYMNSDEGEALVEKFRAHVEKHHLSLWKEANEHMTEEGDPFSGVVHDYISAVSIDEDSEDQ